MNHDDRLVLAVDLGSSGCNTTLVGLDGQVRAFAFRAVQSYVLAGSGVEQCPEDWWQALLESAAEVLDGTKGARCTVVAFCCSRQGEGTLPVDRDGHR